MKKFTSIILTIALVASMGLMATGCSKTSDKDSKKETRKERSKDDDKDGKDNKKIPEETKEDKPVETIVLDDHPSTGSKDAYSEALVYLQISGFSRQGLIDQLTSEWGNNFSVEDATKAVDALEANGEVDWNEQAVISAMNYIESMSYSEKTTLEELQSEYTGKFTKEQAEYAIKYINDNKLVDWDDVAFNYAKMTLNSMAYSKDGLISQTEDEYGGQFTHDQAVNAVERLEKEEKIDWNEQAVLSAKSYKEMFDMSNDEIVEQLTSEYGDKYTKEQAQYAVSKLK